MALARWQATIVDEEGNIVPLAYIEVREDIPGQPLRQVYSDRDGLAALGNPFQADAEGFAAFHVEGGAYQIRAYTGPSGAPTFERFWRYVAIGTAAEFDVNFDGSVLEVQSFWPQYVVETIAERAAYDVGPVFDDQGRRLAVLVTADTTNLSTDSPPAPLPTLYFLLSNDSPAVWSQGFTFPVMVPELADGSFTGDGVTTAFNVGVMVQDARYVLWVEDGIPQRPGIDFTTSGTILTRTTAPASGAIIWWVRTVVNDITGLGSGLNAKVNKTGDTMTGALVLPGNAVNALEAVPKQQLDASIATEVTNRNAAITAAVVGLFDDRGNYDSSVNTFPASGGSGTAGAILKGDIWTISVVGTLGGVAVSLGDTVRAVTDTPGQTAGNWAVGEANIGYVPVAGPAGVTDDLPAIFDGTTGKLIKSKTYAAFKTLLSLVKGDVGLGNVDNTADTAKPVSTAQQTALDLKANLASPALTGNPTAPTQSQADDSTKLATTAYVRAAITAILNGVSAAFDTLAEIATDLGLKLVKTANLSDLANPSTALTNLGVSTFVKTILDDADAAAVRATIGVGAGTGDMVAAVERGYLNGLINGTLVASVSGNALTVAIKTLAGGDPSPSDPVLVIFRNATAATGDFTVITLTAATSFVVSSGSTLGTLNSKAFRIWVVGFNDGGTFRLGVRNCLLPATAGLTILYPMIDSEPSSSTAEGGAGAADGAGVFYAGATVTTKAFRILGYLEWGSGLATAGTWASGPTKIQLFGPGVKKPGDVLQSAYFETNGDTQTTSATYVTTALSTPISPMSAANLIKYSCAGSIQKRSAAAAAAYCRVHRAGVAIGPESGFFTNLTTDQFAFGSVALSGSDKPESASSVTYAIYIHCDGTSTISWNVAGALISSILLEEVMA